VKTVLEHMAERLANGDRIEIRGFGSFSLHYRPGRVGRNPKTGTPVSLPAKYVPHFKPGKELRERVDEAYAHQRTSSRGVSSSAGSGIMSGAAAADPAAAD
jgi:integration host factor subunit beta